jgi:Adenylate and Guanylate cyclase catalytic domain
VSVLFCDLVGFTAASEAADPEDVRARLRPYHTRLRSDIEAYGGTVEKFVGDAVMAVFGAPVAHEDDAERAVRAALTILEAIAELNEADPVLALQVRIGINTGEAVVVLGAKPEEGEASSPATSSTRPLVCREWHRSTASRARSRRIALPSASSISKSSSRSRSRASPRRSRSFVRCGLGPALAPT